MHHSNSFEGLHPVTNFIITLGMFLIGTFMPQIFIIMEYHVPLMIIQILQCLAYIGTATVAGITIYKFYKGLK
ncbi:hypothetical protein UFOVP606_20 [uncultured Caudovirales phage]|uniref:Uncharacterized protein n=1 Tax=uncultured Caudovirales phage TaxID=2100421 RepID=A0A6J5N3Q9_9CAUD|nr:hypothetical protein UFOVP606_20 [uncultured Caudovirales phage]